MKTFRDLLIWQRAMDFVVLIYKCTDSFPDTEKFGLVSQLRRAAISLPSNIAEGYGRNSGGDFNRFLNIAMGSLFEIQTQIELSYLLKYLSKEEFEKLYELTREIERMTDSFIRTLNTK